jgi:hypothetical protein
MDTKKLAQLIKLVVESEIKKQLPKLVTEEVNKRMKVLQETKSTSIIEEVEQDPFALAEAMLAKERQSNTVQPTTKPQRHFTKNSAINEILNQTQPFSSAQRTAGPVGGGSSVLDNFQTTQPVNESYVNSHIPNYMDAEPDIDGTLNMSSTLGAGGVDAMRATMAAKMGYGDMGGSTSNRGGLGVTTGLAGLDRILNRDNSELVKKFKR